MRHCGVSPARSRSRLMDGEEGGEESRGETNEEVTVLPSDDKASAFTNLTHGRRCTTHSPCSHVAQMRHPSRDGYHESSPDVSTRPLPHLFISTLATALPLRSPIRVSLFSLSQLLTADSPQTPRSSPKPTPCEHPHYRPSARIISPRSRSHSPDLIRNVLATAPSSRETHRLRVLANTLAQSLQAPRTTRRFTGFELPLRAIAVVFGDGVGEGEAHADCDVTMLVRGSRRRMRKGLYLERRARRSARG